MTRAKLINTIAAKTGLSAASAGKFYNALLEEVFLGLFSEGKARLPSLAEFTLKDTPPRTRRNPRSGLKFEHPGGKRVSARIMREVQKTVNVDQVR